MPEGTQSKRKPSAAFMKPVQPDEKLAAIIGNEPVPRTEVTRKLWDYIHRNNLQDPANKTRIIADAQLKEVFGGREKVTMFEMTKLIFEHVK
ncbi:MAG TPA: SWIB/MDM2 domain-containing protein [Candidatus Paceibacterota bacterium]|nr:SWIB/MDM2 domain-containing protein [Candidatus Paceibacterota bacterium]